MSMFRFFPGIIIVEAAMVALAYTSMNAADGRFWVSIAILATIIGLLVAFWFGAIADNIKKDALAKAKEDFVRERETLLIAAEADKRSVLEESHKRIVKETNQVHAKANFKLGAAFVGILSVGAVMLSIQLMTIGLLTLSIAGGGLAGYVIRARQDALAYRSKAALTAIASLPPIQAEVVKTTKDAQKKLPQKT